MKMIRVIPHRSLVLPALVFWLISSFAIAEKPDSSSLFSGLRSANNARKLEALQKIYLEYYFMKPYQGRPYVLQALSLSRSMRNLYGESRACLSMAYYHLCLGKQDSSLWYTQMGYEIAHRAGYKNLEALGWKYFGDNARNRGEIRKALDCYKRSLAIDTTDLWSLASVTYSIGLIYSDAGVIDKSVAYYLISLRCKEKLHRWVEAGYLYANLSGTFAGLHRDSMADVFRKRGLEIFRRENFPKGTAYIYNMMAEGFYGTKEYDKAIFYFRKSYNENIKDTLSDKKNFAFNINNIGEAYLREGHLDSAEYYINWAVNYALYTGEDLPISVAYLTLAKLRRMQNRAAEGVRMAEKSLFHSRRINFRGQWVDAYQELSDCYATLGKNELALKYMRKRDVLRDSIITEKAHQAVADMMIKYESDKKDQRILDLSSEKELEKGRARFALVIILLIILTAGTGSYNIWKYYRKKLRPKVQTLDFIQEKISLETEGDNRKLRALRKVLPPELKPFPDPLPAEVPVNGTLVRSLEKLMKEEKIFLDEELTLKSAAERLNTNTTYLSRMINEHYQVNFSTFMANYRVEEAKKMILDEKFDHLSIEGIAKNSGFRSKSTFNQAFKRSTGLTPTEFAAENGKSRS
jgi:AraC-like DNA-binding protein